MYFVWGSLINGISQRNITDFFMCGITLFLCRLGVVLDSKFAKIYTMNL